MSRQPGANHLLGQTSPYLLQHLYNPVDWYPWGPRALDRAREENRPIFLSIGYSACHWCHVMERESFEDPAVADYLNRHFVSIKVDREERPDIDQIYMNAVQLLTGQGGWPLSAFLTPDRKPFFAGTYFPPESRHGLPGFLDLLQQLRAAWDERRSDIDRSAEELTAGLRRMAAAESAGGAGTPIGEPEQKRAIAELTGRFEPRWGGFGGAPKFPPDGAIRLLLLEHGRSGDAVPLEMARRTLDGMALGGIYDQIGGGFARYSVDEKWLVPHFEKMLYNQALLVPLYLDAWRITGAPLYRRVVEETLDFVRRELVDEEGGFRSSLDADSEGEEGKFYVWTADQIVEALGEEQGRLVCEVYGISADGNFEGRSIPNLLHGSLEEQARARGLTEEQLVDRLAGPRQLLRALRERRVRPATDDKMLTAWNGLAISAFALAYRGLRRPDDLTTARAAADFALRRLLRGERLHVSCRAGSAGLNGYLDDYAFLGRGLVDLYEACFDARYLQTASVLARTILTRFEETERGGFFFVSDDHESLLTRNRSLHDGALPAGGGVALELLLRLGVHLDDEALREAARRGLAACRSLVARSPSAFAATLAAADLARGPIAEVAIVGRADDPRTIALLETVGRGFLPRLALAWYPGESSGQAASALAAGKHAVGGRATAFVCRDYACLSPVHDPEGLARQIAELT